jgi:hypothetical protein
MSAGSAGTIPSVDSVIDPLAGIAWELFSDLVDAFEQAVVLSDAQLAQQIWTPLQAANANILAYYNQLLQVTIASNS